ncbi:MAG TPA: hypothetical protein VIX80_05255 [Candidatus Kapabacteria bacterium]
MKRNILICLATTLLFTGCNSNSSEPTNANEISYLKVGNKWIYSFTDFNPDGSIERTMIDSLEVIGTSVIDGKEYFQFSKGGYQRVDEQGLWARNISNSKEILGFKYPTSIGDRWGYDTSLIMYGQSSQDTQYLSRATLKLDTTIQTEAGTFSCIKYVEESYLKSDGTLFNRDYLFVDPKKGLVEAISYDDVDPITNKLYKSSSLHLIKLVQK